MSFMSRCYPTDATPSDRACRKRYASLCIEHFQLVYDKNPLPIYCIYNSIYLHHRHATRSLTLIPNQCCPRPKSDIIDVYAHCYYMYVHIVITIHNNKNNNNSQKYIHTNNNKFSLLLLSICMCMTNLYLTIAFCLAPVVKV